MFGVSNSNFTHVENIFLIEFSTESLNRYH